MQLSWVDMLSRQIKAQKMFLLSDSLALMEKKNISFFLNHNAINLRYVQERFVYLLVTWHPHSMWKELDLKAREIRKI